MLRLRRQFYRLREFLRYVAQEYTEDQCLRAAGALAYTSLLALAPLLTVVFITLSAFPAFQAWRAAFEDFIFMNFVPALGDQVRSYLLEFAANAAGLQAAGIAFLLVTVLLLMGTIESTFSVIWRTPHKRPLVLRMLVYWAVLTVAPLLIGAGLVATSYLASLSLWSTPAAAAEHHGVLLAVFPFLATTLAFVLFYKVIPNRPVPLLHAIGGGSCASALFEIAKYGFAYYVVTFPGQQAVYGALATVPIFLVWLYLCWNIVLLGAEITECLTTFAGRGRPAHAQLRDNPLYVAFRVLTHLYALQRTGTSLSERRLWQLERGLEASAIDRVISVLAGADWIGRDAAARWVLRRDLGRQTVLDLLRLIPTAVVETRFDDTHLDTIDQRFVALMARHAETLQREFALPLAAFLAPPAPALASAPG